MMVTIVQRVDQLRHNMGVLRKRVDSLRESKGSLGEAVRRDVQNNQFSSAIKRVIDQQAELENLVSELISHVESLASLSKPE